nr:MAG TPA: hypothetical protein [Caudoviricetes sp.]
MLELMEEMIEDLREKYYWEKHHKHSKIAKFAIKLCLKEAESRELEITEEDVICEHELKVKYALLWIFKMYCEDNRVMDYMNDSMSFAYDQNIIDAASVYGSAYSRKHYDCENRIESLKKDTYRKFPADQREQIYTVILLATGEDEEEDDDTCYGLFRPVWRIASSIYRNLTKCRSSDIESMVYDNYARILDNIIYGFDKADIKGKIKITEIFALLYATAEHVDNDSVRSVLKEHDSLPIYLMIHIYVLLNNYLADFYKSDVIMNLITGDIDKMDYKELEEVVEKASGCLDINLLH